MHQSSAVLALRLAVALWVTGAGLYAEEFAPFRGITISCQTWGREWENPAMAEAMDEVKQLGANAIAIHPYALISEDGSIAGAGNSEPTHVTTPLKWAREKNLRVMLIPHLGYWHTRFSWRGDITFDSDAEWDRFFVQYTEWIRNMAQIAERFCVELFCIGLEYPQTEKSGHRWREIIREVRAVYHGAITYGANWDQIKEVTFWDAVDLIGVLAYFPLTQEKDPTSRQIADGWKPWMRTLESLSRDYGKPVIFTELGYNESAEAASTPWTFSKGGENARAIQQRCLEQGLILQKKHSFLAGMFLWKWFPDLDVPHEYTFDLRTPALKQILWSQWKNAL
jgi:hypothetical protein